MPSDPRVTVLTYAQRPPLRRRIRWRRWLIAAAAALAAIYVLPAAWDFLRTTHRLHVYAAYAATPDQVVYEDDPAREAKVLFDPKHYTRLAAGRAAVIRRSNVPDLFGQNFESPLFLHERQSPADKEHWIVAVGVPDMSNGTVLVAARLDSPTEKAYWLTTCALCEAPPAGSHFRFYAGQPDPDDPTHFTIRYEMDGHPGTIDGWLQQFERMRLRVHDGPLSRR